MAILPIRMAGDSVLRQKAKKVRTIDASIQQLVDDMIETMRDAPGVGLAASQVGVPLRVIVIEVPEEKDGSEAPEEGDGSEAPEDAGQQVERPPDIPRELYVLINPQIVKRSGERTLDEGCLSIPGYHADVPRSVSVTVKGLDRDGREVRIKAVDNLLAEVLEHEIDHINGVLYIDRLESMDQLIKLEEDADQTAPDGPQSAASREEREEAATPTSGGQGAGR